MNEATPRTPEQDAAVRRRALPVAVAGVICGALGLALLLFKSVDESHPASAFGAYLSYFTIVWVVLIFYARGTSGTRLAVFLSAVAVLLGLAGTLINVRQTVQWRAAMNQRELGNARAIVQAAKGYAQEHGGEFPKDLVVLLDDHRLTPEQLHSPYGNGETVDMREKVQKGKMPVADFEAWLKRHSDYQYFGGDLRLPAAATGPAGGNSRFGELPREIIVASGVEPILRNSLTVGFADDRAEFLDLEQVEAALKASNEAREKLGLPAIRPPETVQKAQELERREK